MQSSSSAANGLGSDEAGDRWVFDRQWWMEPKIWDRGCEFSKDS